MQELINQLNEPDIHFPGNFDTPKQANALLMCLCQEAAEAIKTQAAERDALKAALEKAGEVFDYYAKHHATKTIPEEDKAKRNYEYRNMCREALKGLK